MLSLSDITKLLEQIPLWKRLAALPARIEAVEARLAEAERKLAERPAPEACPLCGAAMQTTAVRPDPTFGEFGMKQHTIVCTNAACRHTDTRQVDPRKK